MTLDFMRHGGLWFLALHRPNVVGQGETLPDALEDLANKLRTLHVVERKKRRLTVDEQRELADLCERAHR